MRAEARNRLLALAGGVTRGTGVAGVTTPSLVSSPSADQVKVYDADVRRSSSAVTPVTPVPRVTPLADAADANAVLEQATSAIAEAALTAAEDPLVGEGGSPSSRHGSHAQEDRLGCDSEWGEEDYQAYFEERAAVYEIDGGLLQHEAERLAFRDTVQQWLALHPAPAREASRGCAHCGNDEQPRNPLLPILARDGHVWVHDGCCEKWLAARRLQARQALMAQGLPVSSGSAPLCPSEEALMTM